MLQKKWKNTDNALYYEITSPQNMSAVAEKGGLANCPDIETIKSYIWSAQYLLEVGANYGRVIEYLLQNDFPGKIHALERSQPCCKLLNKKYGNNASVICTDLMRFSPKNFCAYDAILWMWSGISDFAKEEQPNAIQKLASFLAPKGALILDTMCHERPMVNAGTVEERQEYKLIQDSAYIYGYRPTPEEVIQMGQKASLTLLLFTEYYVSTGVPRRLFIFQK